MLRRRALAGGLVLAALAIWFPRLADAHALVLESSPRADEVLRAAPARIFLRFNSRIEQALSGITVTGPGGRPLPLPGGGAPAGAPPSSPRRRARLLRPAGISCAGRCSRRTVT